MDFHGWFRWSKEIFGCQSPVKVFCEGQCIGIGIWAMVAVSYKVLSWYWIKNSSLDILVPGYKHGTKEFLWMCVAGGKTGLKICYIEPGRSYDQQ
jgi:hypothetical protein